MVPQLEYDGFVLSETGAIVAFLGTQLKLAGESPQDQATCHMVIDLILDYLRQMNKVRFEEDPDRKTKAAENLKEKVAPAFFTTMAKLLMKNDGKHFVGCKVGKKQYSLGITTIKSLFRFPMLTWSLRASWTA